ncbi:hypothetical protein EON65_23190 [archaeon]|nr:MAG: hypothetical protein EON65_23190 [archaeon]
MIEIAEDFGPDASAPEATISYLEWQMVNFSGATGGPAYGALLLSTEIANVKSSFFGGFGAYIPVIKYNSTQFHSFGTLDRSSSTDIIAFVREPYNPSSPYSECLWYRNCKIPIFAPCEERVVHIPESVGPGDDIVYYNPQDGLSYFARRSRDSPDRATLIKGIKYVNMAVGSYIFADSESLEFFPFAMLNPVNNILQIYTLLKVVRSNGQSDIYDISPWLKAVFQDVEVQSLPDGTEQILDAEKMMATRNPDSSDWPIHIRGVDSKVQISSATCSSRAAADICKWEYFFNYSTPVILSRNLQLPPGMDQELRILQELERKLPYQHFSASFCRPLHVLFEHVNLHADALNHYKSANETEVEETTFHVFVITPASKTLFKPVGVYRPDTGGSELMFYRREAYAKYVFTDILAAVFLMHAAGLMHRMIAHHSIATALLSNGSNNLESYFKLINLGQAVACPEGSTIDMRPLLQPIDPTVFFNMKVPVPDYLCPDYINLKVSALQGGGSVIDTLPYSAKQAKMYDVWCLGVLLFYLITLEAPAKVFERLKRSSPFDQGISALPGLAPEYAFIYGWIDSMDSIIEFLRPQYPSFYDDVFDLLKNILAADPQHRFDLQQVLAHKWVRSVYCLPPNYPTRQQIFSPKEGNTTTRNKRSRTREVSVVTQNGGTGYL